MSDTPEEQELQVAVLISTLLLLLSELLPFMDFLKGNGLVHGVLQGFVKFMSVINKKKSSDKDAKNVVQSERKHEQ